MQKRLDCGFRGYQVPRATRSARGKGLSRKNDNQMCAFDLLATVAGKLLCEKETSPAICSSSSGRTPESIKRFKDGENCYLKTNGSPAGLDSSLSVSNELAKQELQDEVKLFKLEVCDQGSSDEGPLASKGGLHQQICHAKSYTLEEVPHDNIEDASGLFSVSTKCDTSAQAPSCGNLMFEVGSNGSGGSLGARDRCKLKVDTPRGELGESKRRWGHLQEHAHDICGSEEPFDLDTKPPALVSSDSSDDGPLSIGQPRGGSLPVCRDDLKLVGKDDDDNSSECSQPSSITVKTYQSSHVGDREIRKMLSSKLWKEAPAILKDGTPFKNDGGKRPSFRSKRTNYKRQRTQRCLPIKRRRLCEQNSALTSYGGVASEGVSSVLEQCTCEGTPGPASRMDEANRVASPVETSNLSVVSTDEKVKLSIKSFKVPELLIEIPATATIGTLKRAVVETVTSMLGGGVQVSVLLQGRKIRDDTKALRGTGVLCSSELDGVDFVLEPNTAVHSPKPCSSDPYPPLSPEETQSLNRHNPLSENSDMTLDGPTAVVSLKPDSCNREQSNCDQNMCPTDLPPKEATPNSRALIPMPAASIDALPVMPVNRKPRHAELSQRRIRRPFSVSEVESLVKAVEKLGTGRWRDVKLLSFDNAKHRTYVDLKDKWKTLVHTARISPQQRRGEPVPQELLDRVLAAHDHWSQQQSKHQVKQQLETRLLL